MKLGKLLLSVTLVWAIFAPASPAQTAFATSVHKSHVYTPYERLVYKNAMVFHKNFDDHQFEKNKAFVTSDLHVISNGREFRGADEYVKSIARFVGPFPDVRITDLSTVVDGNMAAVTVCNHRHAQRRFRNPRRRSARHQQASQNRRD